jgi:hypothetical protein
MKYVSKGTSDANFKKGLRMVGTGGLSAAQRLERAWGLGISIKTLKRAKGELDIKSKKQTFSGKWAWFLPTHSEVWPPSTGSASDKAASQEGQRPPSTESKRDELLRAASDKNFSQEGQWPPSNEASKNAPSSEGGQTPPGVGKNDYEEVF